MNCVGVNKKVRVEHVSFNRQLIRKEYTRLELDCGEEETHTINYQDASNFYELSNHKEIREVEISDNEPSSLYQVW